MADKSAPVSEQTGLVAKKQAGLVVGNSAWDSLGDIQAARAEEKRKNRPVPQDLGVFAQTMRAAAAAKGEEPKAIEALLKYKGLLEKMFGKNADGESWREQDIFITNNQAQKEKNQELVRRLGHGVLYFHGSGTAVPPGMLFFPLHVSNKNTLFVNGMPACVARDGKTGVTSVDIFPIPKVPAAQNYTAAPAGSIHECGSASCPNKPYMEMDNKKKEPIGLTKLPKPFQAMGRDNCGRSKTILFVDSEFTNIYVLDVKNQAVEMTAKLFVSGEDGIISPVNGNWWTLSTYKQEFKSTGGSAPYPRADVAKVNGNPLVIEPYTAQIIQQIALQVDVAAQQAMLSRTNRDTNAKTTIANLESQAEVVDGEASDDDVTFAPLTPSI